MLDASIYLDHIVWSVALKSAFVVCTWAYPDSKVYGVNMGPIWGRKDPGGPHVGHTNFAIWVYIENCCMVLKSGGLQVAYFDLHFLVHFGI